MELLPIPKKRRIHPPFARPPLEQGVSWRCAPAHALQGNIFQFHLTKQGRFEMPIVAQGIACFAKSTFLFAMESGNITFRTVHSTYQSKGI